MLESYGKEIRKLPYSWLVDKTGVVRKVDVGREALDPSGVVGMCQKLETQ